jgi:hypothetical protein
MRHGPKVMESDLKRAQHVGCATRRAGVCTNNGGCMDRAWSDYFAQREEASGCHWASFNSTIAIASVSWWPCVPHGREAGWIDEGGPVMKAMLSRNSASIVGWPCLGVCSPKHTLRHGRICAYPFGTRSMDEGWQSGAAMLRRSDSQAPGVPCAGVGRGLCGHQRRWSGAWGMETAPRRACWHVLLEGRVHRYGCGRGCGYGHGWVKEIKMSRGWLTKDAFLMIVGLWFLFSR